MPPAASSVLLSSLFPGLSPASLFPAFYDPSRRRKAKLFLSVNDLYLMSFRCKGFFQSLRQMDETVVVHDDHFEVVSVLSPVFHTLIQSHDKTGRGQGIRQGAVWADDGHGADPGFGRISRGGIQDVMIGLSCLFILKVSFIGAGGDDRLSGYCQNAHDAGGVSGILNADPPVRPARLAAQAVDVAAQIDKAGFQSV